MKECSKTIVRRLSNPNFIRLYFKGNGIDIGGKPDPLANYTELFPLVKSIRTWDKEDGDAEFMSSIKAETYDFVHSSHCLEHMKSYSVAIENWIRILKPGGYLIVTVPDEDLYEQQHFPSIFNKDHKWTFTIYKHKSWSPKSVNIIDLIKLFDCSVEKIELLNSTYRTILEYDQTLTPIAECGIEFILRKKGKEENLYNITEELQIHLDQYRKDIETLKRHNKIQPPFKREDE